MGKQHSMHQDGEYISHADRGGRSAKRSIYHWPGYSLTWSNDLETRADITVPKYAQK